MQTYQVPENKNFVGREAEINQLREISTQQGAKILVVYGRRRVEKLSFSNSRFVKGDF